MLSSIVRGIKQFFRANFLAGLFVAVPFSITIVFLVWMWGKLQQPLERFFDFTLSSNEGAPWMGFVEAIEKSDARQLLIPLISLILLVIAILLLGILARSIIGQIALNGIENLVGRLPLVGMLYKSLKQLSESVMGSDGHSKFQRAVAVQFPYPGVWAIGFVTGRGANFVPDHPTLFPSEGRNDLLTVFVPTSPIPTAGFMLVVPEKDTINLNVPVQDALKLVVSGGILESKDGAGRPSNVTLAIDRTIQASQDVHAAEQKG
jgi:uncharacterized membrane protein